MLPRKCIGLILILAISALSACGGGGADAGPPPPRIDVTASKLVAFANGTDAVTIRADVKNADGTVVPDGTVITFSVPGGAGALSAATAECVGGTASVTVTHPAITVNNVSVVVLAVVGGGSGAKEVKFINQPASAEVSIAVNRAVAGIAILQLKLNNTAGATFNNDDPQRIVAMNEAAGSIVTGSFDIVSNSSNTIGLVHATGFTTVPGTQIIRATYAVAAGAGLPAFSIDATAPVVAKDLQGPILPELTAEDMVVTVTYDTE